MAQKFPGFSPEGIEFLRELKENNDREWFTPRKHIYEERLRLPMIELVRAIHGEMMRFAPEYVGEPAKCVFRIYRDTRFSKDKTPYKTHVAATFSRGGLDKRGGGFYLGISTENVGIGGGMYSAGPAELLATRNFIAERFDEFRATFEPAKIRKLTGEIQGESTTRPPRGFDPAHPAVEYLKRKQIYFMANLDIEVATTPKLLPEVVNRFEAMTPLVKFLDRAVLGERSSRT